MKYILIWIAAYIGLAILVGLAKLVAMIADGLKRESARRKEQFQDAPATAATAENIIPADFFTVKDGTLTALEKQREIIQDIINDIETQLDYCPPETARKKLLAEKATQYSRLAAVESKIAKKLS